MSKLGSVVEAVKSVVKNAVDSSEAVMPQYVIIESPKDLRILGHIWLKAGDNKITDEEFRNIYMRSPMFRDLIDRKTLIKK